MSKHRSCLVVAALLSALATLPLVAQSPGYLRVRTHLPGESDLTDRGVLHAFMAGTSGSHELDSYALPAGQYILTRVVTLIGNCYAESHDVAVTIVAGQWTSVATQVQFTTCFFTANPITQYGGEGRVTVASSGAGSLPVDCSLIRTGQNDWRIDGFTTCRGQAAHGSSVFIQQHAQAGSALYGHLGIADDSVTLVSDTTGGIVLDLAQIFVGQDFDDTAATGQVADVSVSRVSSTRQGRLMRSTFRVTNHGPGHALGIQPVYNFTGNVPSVGGSTILQVEPSLGNCRIDNHCAVPDLPPDQSMDFTLVARVFPNTTSDPVGDPYCLQFAVVPTSLDPEPGNNSVACVSDSVSVTVTAGSGNGTPVTVAAGSAAVPVLRFTLTPAQAFSLTDITLSATGSGNESVDISAVKLYLDQNGDGQINGSDAVLSQGTFSANDGSVKLIVTPPYGVSAETHFIVTYDFSVSTAGRLGLGLGLGLLGLVWFGAAAPRRRRWPPVVLGLVMVAALSRCGGDSGGPSDSGNPTYRATLSGISADGVAVPGVSVAGATVTVER
ncbi:MAG: hypothetical protein ABJC74_08325 [Gemmatimonadota bacterium]